MIYTMTANPSLDYLMTVYDFKEGQTNRSRHEKIVPGGKGLNIATVLKNFGIPVKTFAVIAGFTGQEWIRRVKACGIDAQVIELEEGQIRINVKLVGGNETEINARGPMFPEEKRKEVHALMEQIKPGDWFCLSGSACPGMTPHAYANMLHQLDGRDVRVIVDATGDQMRNALSCNPYMIKPNLKELEDIANTSIYTEADLIQCAGFLIRMGAQNVLVSAGKIGAYWIGGDGNCYHILAPEGRVKNTVGCGDTMVGAFVYGMETGLSLEETLKMTVAAGSAGAFSENLVTKEEVYDILNLIEIEKIEDGGRKERLL